MTEVRSAPALASEAASEKPRETLSQFVARVLNQLSLSAWLPSAALLLLLTFVLQVDAALHTRKAPPDPMSVMGRAFTAMASIGLGAAIFILVGVVVLTIVTQAFTFEAIRILEGYWGTNRVVEWFAHMRCEHFRRVRRQVDRRHRDVTKEALRGASRRIKREDKRQTAAGSTGRWTTDMLQVLQAGVLKKPTDIVLSDAQDEIVLETDWRTYAGSELLRRRLNLDKRLRDFPEADRVLPTRFGNVMRRHEDLTGRKDLESFIAEVYENLSPSEQSSHDEQRTRLDLYCSMVFVLILVAAVAVGRFAQGHWPYAAAAAAIGCAGAWLMNRAAVASARAYGALLVTISKREDVRPVA